MQKSQLAQEKSRHNKQQKTILNQIPLSMMRFAERNLQSPRHCEGNTENNESGYEALCFIYLGGAVVGAAASFTAVAGGCLLGDGCLANSEEATAVKEASSSFLGGKEEEENESHVFGLASALASVALLLINCGSGPLEAASCGCGWKVPNNPPGCSRVCSCCCCQEEEEEVGSGGSRGFMLQGYIMLGEGYCCAPSCLGF